MKEDTAETGETVRHPAIRDTAGIGYIIVPNNIDYYDYVTSCMRNSTVCIITQDGEIIKNVIVSKNTWNDIDFPRTPDKKGSAVAWLNISNKNKPIILCALNKIDELNNNRELNSFNFSREDLYTSVHIEGDGKTGTLNIFVDGETKGESVINFKITNSNNLGELNIYVQGDILFESENDFNIKLKNKLHIQIIDEEDSSKQTNISYELRTGFTYIDEFENKITISEKGVEIIDKNKNNIITHEGGIEAIVDSGKISLKSGVAGMLFKGKVIKIDDSGIIIDSMNGDIQINAGDNVIQMTDSGINIDSGDKNVSINGSNQVLYSKIPGSTEIIDFSQIGVSKKVKIG
jgi:hypothetical protein